MTQYDCIPAILIPVGAGVVVRPLYTNLPQIKTAVAVIPNLKGISYLMKCPLNSTAFVDISRKTLEMFRNYSVLLELPIIIPAIIAIGAFFTIFATASPVSVF